MLAWWWVACSGQGKDPGTSLPDHTGIVDADGDGSPASEDCDDGDIFVYPGAPDAPYDGVDSDCAGDDDDDADADGHRALSEGGDDCNDLNDAVSPSLAELPYDGQDNDCDPGTPDDDLDGDGFRAFEECDDTDAGVGPDRVEVAFDGLDQDCDGVVDASRFGVVPWGFSVPHAPRAVDTPHGVAVVLRADRVVPPSPQSAVDGVVVAVPLPHDLRGNGPLAEPPTVLWGRADDNPIRDVAVAVRGDDLAVGLAWPAGNGYGYLSALPTDWIPGVGWFAGAPSYTEEVFQDHLAVDTWVDGSDVLVAGGGASGVGWALAGPLLLADGGVDLSARGGIATFRDPGAPDTFVTCDGTDCASWAFDPRAPAAPVPAGRQPWSGRQVAWGRSRGDAVVWSDGGRGLWWTDGARDAQVLDGEFVSEGDLTVVDDTLYGVVVVGGELRVLRGPLGGPHEDVTVPVVTVDGVALAPTAAAIVVTADALFLAVSALDPSGGADADAVLYSVLER